MIYVIAHDDGEKGLNGDCFLYDIIIIIVLSYA